LTLFAVNKNGSNNEKQKSYLPAAAMHQIATLQSITMTELDIIDVLYDV